MSSKTILTSFSEIWAGKPPPLISTRSQIPISWDKPPPNWIKLNCDGSAPTNKNGGCGGVIRNHLGQWIAGFSAKLHHVDPITAEAWGIFHGLQFLSRFNFRLIEIETDSDLVFNILQGIAGPPGKLANCRSMCRSFTEIRFSNIFRAANRIADSLAKLASTMDQDFAHFHDPPDFISVFLAADASHRSAFRLV